MQRTPEIIFHGVDLSPAVRDEIESRVEKLERFADDIIGCRVVVEAPHRHAAPSHHAVRYAVNIDVAVPGEDIHVHGEPGDDTTHEDVFIAVRDAFEATERLLRRRAEVRRREVKQHAESPVEAGKVVKVFRESGYGFVESAEGDEVYFHRNAVASDGFDQLDIGTSVTFVREDGEKGPQASTLHVNG